MGKLTLTMLSAVTMAALTVHADAAWQCPATRQTHPLTEFTLYPGDPAQVSNVIPDSNHRQRDGSYTGIWTLEPTEQLVALCRYTGGKEETVKLPAGLHRCRSGGRPPHFRASCN